MGQLTNLYVSQSYQGLIKLANSATGVTGTLQYTQDGVGNNLPIQISTSSVNITGSFTVNGQPISVDSGSLVTTASFNAFTASIDGRVDALELETGSLQSQINQKLDTGSFNSYTSSNDSKVNSLINSTGSYATTSSLTALSQSIALTDLNQNNVIAGLATTASLTSLSQSIATTDLGQDNRLGSLETATGSLQNQINQKLNTGSFNSYTSSNDARVTSLESKTGSYATTGSNIFQGNQTITGSLDVTGEITALSASITYLEVIYQTSSVIFSSGSNILGDEAGDTQTLWGTVKLPTGPLSVTGSATISGNLNVQTSLTASGLNYPTTDGTSNQILATNGAGTLSFIDIAATNITTITEAVRYGENITIGDPLYVSGSNGTRPIVYKADAADPNKMPVIYVASSTANANTNTTAIALGLITNVTTTGYPDGTLIYVGEGGGWSSSRPTGSSSIVQPLGIVTKEGSGGSGRGLVLNPGPVLLPNIQTGYAWVGNGTNQPVQVATSSLSVASAVSSSYSTNALSASYATQALSASYAPIPSGTVSGSQQIVDLGFATTSSVNQKLDTGSFNTYTASMDARTGSYATTGSNNFIGNQTITGSVDIRSGSLELFSNNTTVNTDLYLTSSQGQSNMFFGWGDNPALGGPLASQANYTGSLRITGSNNIVNLPQIRGTNFQASWQGHQGYISGSNNWINGNNSGIYLATGSLLFPKTQGNILGFGSAIGLSYTTSSLGSGQIQNNTLYGGQINIVHNSGSAIVAVNLLNSGQISSTQNFVTNVVPSITANMMLGGTIVLNHVSSSISVNQNFVATPLTVNNHVSSSITNNLVALNNNMWLGGSNSTGPGLWLSGSQSSNVARAISDNLIGGRSNIISSSFVSSSNSNLYATLIFGQNLTVSGSHGTAGGSAFLGRYNDTTSLHLAQDVVFAVGTGTGTSNRRTGLYVTSGSLVGVSGSLNVNGPTIMSSSTPYSLYASGTIATQRIHFDNNPFNANVSSNLGAIRIDDLNESLNTTMYNKAEISSASYVTQTVNTGSNFVRTQLISNYAGTSAVLSLNNFNGSRVLTSNVDTEISGSLIVTGSVAITGSVQGNVLPLTVASNTASLNLNNGNFFVLALTGSQDIRIEPSNIKPGQTINIKLNTTGSGTVSFPTSVLQPSGSAYVPTTEVGTDIITMVSFDSTNLFVANVKNLI
jgi:hypothetical protein